MTKEQLKQTEIKTARFFAMFILTLNDKVDYAEMLDYTNYYKFLYVLQKNKNNF